jgi:hypothetical protein
MSEEIQTFGFAEDYRSDVNAFLRASVMRACTDRERGLLLTMLDFDAGVSEAARIIGMDPKDAYGLKNRAARKVSAYMRGAGKKRGAELDIGRYSGVGVAAWRARGFTSVTEAEAVWRSEIDLLRGRLGEHE